MVKHWFILMVLGARDTYDMYDWHVLREGTSYSIDRTEFTDAKGGENGTNASVLDGTAAAMLNAGVAISSISSVQFITVANPENLRVVFDEIQKS
jgi:hypothetical protein